jgi:hypothetical protein
MSINALLAFMVLSQIALAAYLLYSFNTLERAAEKRNGEMRKFLDGYVADLERRLGGSSLPPRKRVAGEN